MTKIISNKSSADLDYPVVRPSLDLDFTQEELDPRITFSRGSIGTRVNRNRLIETVPANQPRFDYDPVTGECKGLLIEESRVNNFLYSEDFSNAYWTKNNVSIISNAATAPDGTLTADLNTGTGASNTSFVERSFTTLSAGTYTFSYYAKSSGQSRGNIAYIDVFDQGVGGDNTNRVRATVNLNTGVISPIVGTSARYNAQNVGNGWWRIIGYWTPTNPVDARFRIGDNASGGIYIWGAQLETGAFPTSYIPTTASTVTRSADVASMTGTNFSSWYNQNEGTVYLSLIPNYSNTVSNQFRRFLSINVSPGSGQDNVIQVIGLDSSNQLQSALWFNSVFQVGGNTTVRSGTEGKIAFSLRQNSSISSGNGLINTIAFPNDTSCILPSNMNRMDIGGYGGIAGYQSNGCYKRFTYYPRALKPNQLQYLTQ